MSEYEQAVFISYAWGGEREDIVNQIDEALQKRGIKIIRDKRSLGYRGSIKDFMERIGLGDCVIVVVSDKYLRSPNCMFELVEIAENNQFHDRIFPVVLADADIYKPVRQIEYVQHWENEIKELKTALGTVDPTHLEGSYEQLNLYDRIRDNISRLTAILSDMNTLTPDMHRDSEFSELYEGVVQRLDESTAGSTAESNPMVKSADEGQLAQAKKEPVKPSPATENSSSSNNIQNSNVSGGFNIQGMNVSGVSMQAGGDMVAGNKTTTVAGSNEPKKANPIKEGFERINQQIDKLPDDPDVDKSYLKLFVKDIEREATKESGVNEKKLKNSLQMLTQNSEEVYSNVAGLLKSPEVDAPLEILNLLD